MASTKRVFIGHRNGTPVTQAWDSVEKTLGALREILSDPHAGLKAGDRLAVLDDLGRPAWKAVV